MADALKTETVTSQMEAIAICGRSITEPAQAENIMSKLFGCRKRTDFLMKIFIRPTCRTLHTRPTCPIATNTATTITIGQLIRPVTDRTGLDLMSPMAY